MENPNLPKELVRDIMLRLPVKSLLRFKCVSKEWNTLIGSSGFANQHFVHESNQEGILVRYCKSDDEKYAFALYVDDLLSQYEEPDHLQVLTTLENVMGPLNGVFCLVNISGKIAFLNPAMRQFRLLPDLDHSSYINQPHLSFDDQTFGFGLDPLSGDFKLVSVQYFRDEENDVPYYPCVISVYNSGSDSWRHFEEGDLVNSNREIYKPRLNTYVNEVYYWIMEHRDDDRIVCILAFDMRTDKFQEIEAPNDHIDYEHANLGLYGDSLALLCHDEVDNYVHVWIMEREGYWNRSIMVGPIEDLCWPLGFWKKKVLSLKTKTYQVLSTYDVCTRILRSFEHHITDEDLCWIFIYKESLVSIKGRGDKCYLWDTSSGGVKDFFEMS